MQAAELYEMSKGYKWLHYECTKEVELIKEKTNKLEENTKKKAENAACKNCASAIPIVNIDETTPANSTPEAQILADKPDVQIPDNTDAPTPMDTSQHKHNDNWNNMGYLEYDDRNRWGYGNG